MCQNPSKLYYFVVAYILELSNIISKVFGQKKKKFVLINSNSEYCVHRAGMGNTVWLHAPIYMFLESAQQM